MDYPFIQFVLVERMIWGDYSGDVFSYVIDISSWLSSDVDILYLSNCIQIVVVLWCVSRLITFNSDDNDHNNNNNNDNSINIHCHHRFNLRKHLLPTVDSVVTLVYYISAYLIHV